MKKSKRITDENGDEWFEAKCKGKKILLPVHPDVVYKRTGEWKGWNDFLGVKK